MGHYDNMVERDVQEALKEHATKAAQASIDDTLNERGARYGTFTNHAELSQNLKGLILQHYFSTHGKEQAPQLPPYMVEAISMICHKLARIANGDPTYIDSWRDISAYSELVTRELATTEGATDSKVQTVTYKNGNWS